MSDLRRTKMYLDMIRTHVVEADRIFDLYELDVTQSEQDDIRNRLKHIELVIDELCNTTEELEEIAYLNDKFNGDMV